MSDYDRISLNVNGTVIEYSWFEIAHKLGFDEIQSQYEDLAELQTETSSALDVSWVMLGTVLVFFMQSGFTMVEVGSVRIKSTKSILIKNLMDACLGSVMFFFYGWAFAFGKGNAFMGYNGFILKNGFNVDGTNSADPLQYAAWTFQFTFCATASTIVSGAVAERTHLLAYMIYTAVLVTIIYPPVAHWIWTSEGWANGGNENPLFGVGVIDYAGVIVVHTVGGTCALLGAVFVGPRQGRFSPGCDIMKQNAVFQVLGTLILWFGWYGFNGGSTLGLGGPQTNAAAKIGVATTISATASGTATIILNFMLDRKCDPAVVCNGILAGLVSITGACAVVLPETAFVIGVIGAHVYYFSSKLLVSLKIDDVVDASPVHLFCGIWGAIAPGLFSNQATYRDAYPHYTNQLAGNGLFYDKDVGGKHLAANLVVLMTAIVWTSAIAGPLFFALKQLHVLRILNIHEIKGLDKVVHGGEAYENPVNTQQTQSTINIHEDV